jgi:hypothetical protein
MGMTNGPSNKLLMCFNEIVPLGGEAEFNGQ